MIPVQSKSWIGLCLSLVLCLAVQAQGASDGPVPTTNGSSSTTSRKPLMLFGRIEEIASQKGAKLPIELRPLTPKMDTSLSSIPPPKLKTGTQVNAMGAATGPRLSGRVGSDPFPSDWRGIWGGTLKVFRAEFDPICWQFDADEANKEREILAPGTSGDVNFEFSQNGSRIDLRPAQLIISVPISKTRYSDSLGQLLGGLLGSGQSGGASNMLANMSVPYALHLGSLEQGVGVTGNTLQARLLKNSVRQLAPGVVEQQVITYNGDRSSATGNVRYTYSESVLRFYRQSSNQLYVQAAMVSYLPNGHFKDKVILVGTVTRGQVKNSMPDLNSLLNGMQ